MIQKGDPLNLTGKVAVITGAGSGIGLGVAQMLSAYGASVAIVDVSPKSEAAAQELRDAGRDAAFFQCDVTNEQSVIDTVNAIVAKFGRIDILHNNAGVTVRKSIDQLEEKEWDFVLDVGLKGLFLMSKHVIPEMRKVGGGSIVNTGSGWGLKGGDQAAAYCAVKGGIVNVTRAMAIDHGKDNIRVNSKPRRHRHRDDDQRGPSDRRDQERCRYRRVPQVLRQRPPARPYRPARGHRQGRSVPVLRPGFLGHRRCARR